MAWAFKSVLENVKFQFGKMFDNNNTKSDASESACSFLIQCREEYMGYGFDRDTLLNGNATSF